MRFLIVLLGLAVLATTTFAERGGYQSHGSNEDECKLITNNKLCGAKGGSFMFEMGAGGVCWSLITSNKTWPEAQDDCEKKGARLVVVNNDAKRALIRSEYNALSSAWVGLRKSSRAGAWIWIDDSKLNESVYSAPFWAMAAPTDSESRFGFFEIMADRFNRKLGSDKLGAYICEACQSSSYSEQSYNNGEYNSESSRGGYNAENYRGGSYNNEESAYGGGYNTEDSRRGGYNNEESDSSYYNNNRGTGYNREENSGYNYNSRQSDNYNVDRRQTSNYNNRQAPQTNYGKSSQNYGREDTYDNYNRQPERSSSYGRQDSYSRQQQPEQRGYYGAKPAKNSYNSRDDYSNDNYNEQREGYNQAPKKSSYNKNNYGGESSSYDRKPSYGGSRDSSYDRKPSYGGSRDSSYDRKPSYGGSSRSSYDN